MDVLHNVLVVVLWWLIAAVGVCVVFSAVATVLKRQGSE
jgi:hypothetical protein